MDDATQEKPHDIAEAAANCRFCGQQIYSCALADEPFRPIPFRKVTGTFIQFVDEESASFGPHWAVCDDCQTDPLALPEVQEMYRKLKAAKKEKADAAS